MFDELPVECEKAGTFVEILSPNCTQKQLSAYENYNVPRLGQYAFDNYFTGLKCFDMEGL